MADSSSTDQPWLGDACSLVDAFRRGERSPREELEATLAAIERSDINAFSHLDPERARQAADEADVGLPFGGVPFAIKELDEVEGWPDTGASLVFKDRKATHTSFAIDKVLNDGGAVPVGLTTASEFGGLNVSVTKLNGVTHNPWQHGRTAGGSSGGSAAAVAGGLVSLASGGDGGGSIRIPAGYTGLLGFKGTYGRISRGPRAAFRPGTVVVGNLARSVRDVARYYDVAAGVDPRDPTSLPSHGRWEADLGTHDLKGRRFAVVPALGGVTLEPGVEENLRRWAADLAAATGMVQVEVDLRTPNLAAMWMMGNLSTLLPELGNRWPRCAKDMTDEVALGVYLSQALYNLESAAVAEHQRLELHEAMAAAFDQVDFVIAATNPGPAFKAESTKSADVDLMDKVLSNPAAKLGLRGALTGISMVSGAFHRFPAKLVETMESKFPDLVAMGGLTIASNVYGNPAVSIPAGLVNDLPVGAQVLAPHHQDGLLLDVALSAEREIPWPLVAPSVSGTSTPVTT